MNRSYLDTLPGVPNIHQLVLEEGEKVVFAAKMSTFGTEKDRVLGSSSTFSLTNRRIVANNGVGIWIIDLAEDVASWERVQGGRIFKHDYFSLMLHEEMSFDGGKQTLRGFHFYFSKTDSMVLEEIVRGLFS
jgi:hypothetical protein